MSTNFFVRFLVAIVNLLLLQREGRGLIARLQIQSLRCKLLPDSLTQHLILVNEAGSMAEVSGLGNVDINFGPNKECGASSTTFETNKNKREEELFQIPEHEV